MNKILVVSNMYPDKKHPYSGIFVKNFCLKLDEMEIPYSVSVMYKKDSVLLKLLEYVRFYLNTFFKCLFGGYKCIYVHYASNSSPTVLMARKLRTFDIITNVHGSDVFPENKTQEKMNKYTERIIDKSCGVVVPSEYFRKAVADKYHFDESKVYIYPSGGIDKNVFFEKSNKQKTVLREEYGFVKDRPVFGMAGRISEGKGWDTFIEAIDLLKKDGIKATFAIAGSGREDDKLEKFITEYKLENDITRIGMLSQNELCDFYNSIDYFVFPTRRKGESLGLVAIEAMACGVPVIASDFAAPKYYMQDGVNGYKFSVNNSQQLAEVIKQCCISVDTCEYRRLHDGAIETAEAYSGDNVRRKLEVIMSCVAKKDG